MLVIILEPKKDRWRIMDAHYLVSISPLYVYNKSKSK